jgi:hypothetical protein
MLQGPITASGAPLTKKTILSPATVLASHQEIKFIFLLTISELLSRYKFCGLRVEQ